MGLLNRSRRRHNKYAGFGFRRRSRHGVYESPRRAPGGAPKTSVRIHDRGTILEGHFVRIYPRVGLYNGAFTLGTPIYFKYKAMAIRTNKKPIGKYEFGRQLDLILTPWQLAQKRKLGKWWRGRTTASSNRRMIMNLHQKVRQQRPETHFHTASQALFDITNAGHLFLLNNIASGDLSTNRTGREVQNKYITLRWNIQHNPATHQHVLVRLMILKMKESGSPSLAVGQILVALHPLSPKAVQAEDNLRVLYDQLVTLDASHLNWPVEKIFRKLPFRSKWHTASGGDTQENSLWFYVITDTATVHSQMRLDWQLRFTE